MGWEFLAFTPKSSIRLACRTWLCSRALGQGRRYLVVAGASYGLTAISLAVLPSALDRTAPLGVLRDRATLSLGSFLLLRRWVCASGSKQAWKARVGFE